MELEQQKYGVLGLFLDKIVSDIFDSSSSDEDTIEDGVQDFSHTDDNVRTFDAPTENELVLERLRRNISSKYTEAVLTRQGIIDILISTCCHKEFKEYFK